MKKILLTAVLLTLLYVSGFSQTLNKKTLCKKWYLEKYDYILLKSDMTYVGLDEGVKTSGKWTFNAAKKYFTMFNAKKEGIKFIIDELSVNKMVLNIDIKEMDGVDIHYTTKK